MKDRNFGKLNLPDLYHKLKQVLPEYPLISTYQTGINGTYKAIDGEGNVWLVAWDFNPDVPVKSQQFVMDYHALSRVAVEQNRLAPTEGWVIE
jgi:hypothetical protein